MPDEQHETPASTGTPQEVDRIRDIIFGSQMRDYEQRFQTLRRDLERLQSEIDRLNQSLNTQDSEQGKKLQALGQELRQADSELRDEMRETAQRLTNDKADRFLLADLFIELGNQLKHDGSPAGALAGPAEPE